MKNWLFATVALISQEVVALNALLYQTHTGVYSVWMIHILFVLATIFDIWIGFAVGRYLHKRHTKGKIIDFTKKLSARFEKRISKNGKRLSFLLLGCFSFPYLNGFLATWIDISFLEAFILLFIGNMISYVISWLIVLGVALVLPPGISGLIAILVVSGLIALGSKIFKGKI